MGTVGNNRYPAELSLHPSGWFEQITPEFTVKAPVCGAQGYFNAPEVTLPEDSHLTFTNTMIPTGSGGMLHFTEGDPAYWDVSEETVFTAGSRYSCVVALAAEYGYYPSDTAVVHGADDVTIQYSSTSVQYRITVTAAHDYQFDSFVWGESGDTAQAKLVCTVHEDQAIYEDAAISEEFHPATPSADAYTVYTALYGEHSEQNTVTQPGWRYFRYRDTAHIGDTVWDIFSTNCFGKCFLRS